jgi:enamidase
VIDLLIENVGTVVTGRLDDPVVEASSIFVDDGVISEVGATATDANVVVDAAGGTVTSGLLDSHVHPTFGDYTPR